MQGGPRQPRGDHRLLHARQRHLLQAGSRFCPQFPGDHLHEAHLLRQLLRLREFPHTRVRSKMSHYEKLRLVARSQFTTSPFTTCFAVSVLIIPPPDRPLPHLHTLSPQLWGVIKQGYRCKGNYCSPARCTSLSLRPFGQTAVWLVVKEEASGGCRGWFRTKAVVRLFVVRLCRCMCAAHCELRFEAHKTDRKKDRENHSAASSSPSPQRRCVISVSGVKQWHFTSGVHRHRDYEGWAEHQGFT